MTKQKMHTQVRSIMDGWCLYRCSFEDTEGVWSVSSALAGFHGNNFATLVQSVYLNIWSSAEGALLYSLMSNVCLLPSALAHHSLTIQHSSQTISLISVVQ